MAVLFTPPFMQFLDADGKPLSGGKIYSYAAGTTTPKPTYSTADGTEQLTNPVVLDSSGRAVIFIQGSYRFDIFDASGSLIRSVDNVTSFQTVTDSSDAFFESFSGDGTTTSFTLSSNLGTDEKSIMVFVKKSQESFVTNGAFATDTDWTKGTGWTIGSGVATAAGAISTALIQTSPKELESGKAYRLTYTVTRSAGGIIPSIGGRNGTERVASGTYTEIIVADTTQIIAFTGNAFTGTVDTITIENIDLVGFEIQSPGTYTLNGTNITFSIAPSNGSNNVYVFAPTTLIGAAASAADQAILAETGALAAQAAAEAAAAAVSDQKLVWLGEWVAGTYQINDAVAHLGSSWIALAVTTDEPSSVSSDWDLLAAAGANGTGGIATPVVGDTGAILRASGAGAYAWWGGTQTVASAATVDLSGSKPYVTISGTTTITSLGSPYNGGEVRIVRFTAALTLTNGATLQLPTGANIITAADDVAMFVSRGGASGWRCVSYTRASGAPLAFENSSIPMSKLSGVYDAVVDRAYAEYTANSDITTVIPADDTVPLVSEGTQIASVTLTPKTATNIIRLRFDGTVCTTGVSSVAVALFDGSTCVAAKLVSTPSTDITDVSLTVEIVPGVTTAKTYALRVGPGVAGTMRLNGSGTQRYLGGATRATLIAEELRA